MNKISIDLGQQNHCTLPLWYLNVIFLSISNILVGKSFIFLFFCCWFFGNAKTQKEEKAII